nr:unnamed protein product [Digitaria exilis]
MAGGRRRAQGGRPDSPGKGPNEVYKAFFYYNSTAFVASLAAIVLVQSDAVLKRNALEAAMILDLCRDAITSVAVAAIAGAVPIYVVIHVVFCTMDHKVVKAATARDASMEKRRKRRLLFAIFVATITYQAGLTPPSGLWPKDGDGGRRAGDPILLHNYPRRYVAFFYCNTVSFMSSVAVAVLLMNPNLYRPAIRSYALSVCTVASMHHLRTSIYVFALVAALVIFLPVAFLLHHRQQSSSSNNGGGRSDQGQSPQGVGNENGTKPPHTKRNKYLMMLGILAASWHEAGDPVLHDNRRGWYNAFFYCNSTSFVASVVVIVLLLLEEPDNNPESSLTKAINMTIMLDLLGLLVAYGAGSGRDWAAIGSVAAVVLASYIGVYDALSSLRRQGRHNEDNHEAAHQVVVP